MSISFRQFQTALREAALEVLRDGRLPSLSRLGKSLRKRLPEAQDTPTFKVRRQGWRQRWNLGGMNSGLREAAFDLDVAYQTVLDVGRRILRRSHAVESASRVHHGQLDRLETEARNLLFVLQDGDGHFAGLYDDFGDLSKVDLVRSTRDVVDLTTATAELPTAAARTRRVDLSHLLSASTWSIIPSVTGELLESRTAPDAPFGNLFSDVLAGWRHDVVASEPGPSTLRFTLPLTAESSRTVSISRVLVAGLAPAEQSLQVEFTQDGVNFVPLPGVEGPLDLEKSSRSVAVDFEETRMRALRLTLRRSNHDREVEGRYVTSFGLSTLALYATGRPLAAELISQPQEVPDTRQRIERVALSVLEEIPAGTRIDYSLATLSDDEDDRTPLEQLSWMDITPLGRSPRNDEPPRQLIFGSDATARITLAPESPLDPLLTHKGVDYYDLGAPTTLYAQRLVTEDVVFGSALLWRGENSWARVRAEERASREATNAYLLFGAGARQKLYAVAREKVALGPTVNFRGADRTTLSLSRVVDYRPEDGMTLTPPEGSDPYTATTPLHTLYGLGIDTGEDTLYEDVTLNGTTGTTLSGGPVDLEFEEVEEELLLAYKPDKDHFKENLATELHSRQSLSAYHNKLVVRIEQSTEEREDDRVGPASTTVWIGTDTTAGNYREENVEVSAVTPVPANTKRPLAALSDTQLLNRFGRITIKRALTRNLQVVDQSTPTTQYQVGSDVSFEQRQIDGLSRVVVRRTGSSNVPDGGTVRIYYRAPTSGFLGHVLAVEGRTVYLDRVYSLPAATRVEVGYRFVPVNGYEVVPGTLEVHGERNGQGLLFVEGQDYSFDPKTGTLTRLPGGAIQGGEDATAAYARFRFYVPSVAPETFTTWVKVDRPEGTRFEFVDPGLDTEAGERFLLETPNGIVDLTSTSQSPHLEPGWHRFVVRSLSPDTHPEAAIAKIALLQDAQNHAIFFAGGRHFSGMTANRIPLRQIPYGQLIDATPPDDHRFFAINQSGQVVVNFQPDGQGDYYTLGWRDVLSEGSPVETSDHYNEQFVLEYRYRREGSRAVRALVLRARLSREPGSSPSLTPKLHGYQLRCA